jgi:(1->4)-alpha-D-glucan 1-alpha-D-glucosylmutase
MTLARWSRMNKAEISKGDEYHYYQALIGIWPGKVTADLAERLKAYMLKAAREAKLRTSWINPDADYEKALERFVEQSLQNESFIRDLDTTVATVARVGEVVSLSQALVKVASPGVPDYYQGTEILDFSLVDPDNRRPVDYALRKKMLDKPTGKLHVIRQGLEVRRKYPHLFHGARYTPLYADGGREDNIIAFSLADAKDCVVAVAPRLFAHLLESDKPWGESSLALPAGEFLDVMSGARHAGGRVRVAELLSRFPVALLVRS